MKHAKHTPAPWTVDPNEPSFVHANGYPVSIPGNADDIGSPTAIADARLIASAPELLEALEAMLKFAPISDGPEAPIEYIQALRAIEKATGGSK